MNKLLVIPSLFFLSINAFAQAISCSDNVSMKIPEQTSPRYNLMPDVYNVYTLTIVTHKPSDTIDEYKTTILANNLKCDIDGYIASCSQNYGLPNPTKVNFEKVWRKSINPFTKSAEVQETFIELTYGNQLIKFRESDCQAYSF